ncbi:MAG TPA: energy transducer TonB [SAR86 cluster bacterium]|jgi:protein TonB|nr:energy transducer TonB [SAR86 cluster bacterium]HJM15697.1 energy transducer TonB [SAR86 cluster bacterium]
MGFLAEQNLKMLGSTLTASLFLTVSIFYLMQWLIDVGDVELDNTSIKIADVTMPERELELLMDMERPQEDEPPPETMPPEFDMTPPAEVDSSAARPNLGFKGKKAGVFADGSYVPIFQVPPVYPRRALERGIEGCVMLKFTVTKVGSTKDPMVEWAVPPGIFDRAAMRSALKYKYKPQIRDGEAIEVPNVRTVVIFKIEDANKSMDYVPEGCA